jgi:hypothetical protein
VIHRFVAFDRTPARPRRFRHPRNGPAVIGDGAGPRRPRYRRGSINYRVYHSAVENGPRLLCASQCAASQPRGTDRVLAASSTSSNRLRRRLGERIYKAASLGVCR